MTQESKVTGWWWIFGRAEEPHFGSLSLDDKGIKLKILHPVSFGPRIVCKRDSRQRRPRLKPHVSGLMKAEPRTAEARNCMPHRARSGAWPAARFAASPAPASSSFRPTRPPPLTRTGHHPAWSEIKSLGRAGRPRRPLLYRFELPASIKKVG